MLPPFVDTIGQMSERTTEYDRPIEGASEIDYPETAIPRQAPRVGLVTPSPTS